MTIVSETTKGIEGMTILKSSNTDKSITDNDTFLPYVSMRESFFNWLVDGNAKKYSVEVILSCIDKISDYAIKNKISIISFWEYIHAVAFKDVYNKVLEAKLLRITDNRTYKVFILAGQLYIKFLKQKPWIHKVSLSDVSVNGTIAEKQVDTDKYSVCAINPEDVITWLVTQPNANGTLYLEHVVRKYMRSLRYAPIKLFSLSIENRDVFACHTVTELDELWSIFKAAPNYKKVNNDTRGMFSAGLGAYRRYLEKLADNNAEGTAVQLIESPKLEIGYPCKNILLKNLDKHFQNGFRINSPVEMRRFRRFVMEDYGEDIMLSDEELTESILSYGTLFEGKVYIVQDNSIEKIKSKIDSAIKLGVEIIFYSAFYEDNEEWLFPAGIISGEMLKNAIMKLYPRFLYKKNYLAVEVQTGSELEKIRYELLRVWGDEVLLSYEQLSERLSYIPVEKIKYALSQSGDFIWNSEGIYTQTEKVDITDEECTAIADFVATAYLKNGYASLNDIPLGEIRERNYELTLTAIHNAVFAIVLADKYDKGGKIIIRKGDILDALCIMKEYCGSMEKCSLRDLLNFERELTGEIHRWIPMEAGYAVMIRSDEDTFLAEKYVCFNVFEIDNVLEQFVEGNYLPLRSITTFSVFPDCGQSWNLFLLESYCRRFSERFRFEVLAVNSKNAGVIVRKNCTASYIEIMADAVAVSSITLEKTVIEDFLYNNGYIGKRSYSKTNELIELANAIRERRN